MSLKNQFGKKGWTPALMKSQKGKTFLITGATSGTGYEAARILLSKGATVVMLNRNPQKSEETIAAYKNEFGDNIDVSYITVDLGKQTSVKNAAAEILEKVTRIDALLCNGAIAQVPNQIVTEDGWESQLGVNYFGHFTLQALLYPLIEKSKGRIVTVGSMGYDMGLKTIKFDDLNWDKDYTANDAYSQSKLAQIMSIYELQNRLDKAGKKEVKAYACHPGSSRTSLISTSGSLLMKIIFGIMKLSPLTQPAKNGAYPELMCATEKDLDQTAFYGPTGRSNWVGPVGAHKLEPHAKDKIVAKKLWEISEKAIGLQWNL
ncbi:SDR family NAD(P)-dependent oxidoreductase [Flammeovirga kamogawensis]|uniref:SDR family NAD(P)-dependent oxidoreductase n=1 Tax=Flammeovirga kamogawensis TaxID=373891 RepID=A0ABX8GQD0_9BACT|nr:SDR family NAD(P)-dependent oxidoreductase [Flammeovirga kamogawensis]MBB6463074.1 NAD(P)-dependent dehydrogenase (short-subunit alcohol dehydrogenase family) [Flammeovirga kamogawensis]QWG05711.1 SDR family NAD(P)-dependent oxidoreductase [Flammeovirga kamogawensis]TRX67539.1 SDR family NAD(P)-dependent oxidoreductase [Flammeovirga kamogawensis]